MSKILAYHITLSCYGFWLPNDPRGSGSANVSAFHLRPFGEGMKVNTRYSVAHKQHDQAMRLAAKQSLKYPPVKFNGKQARAVARGFSEVSRECKIRILALAIMPDHVHLVSKVHDHLLASDVAKRLKAAATRQLNKESLGFGRSPWARKQWIVHKGTIDSVQRAIDYVNDNPIKAGLKPQRWRVVADVEF